MRPMELYQFGVRLASYANTEAEFRNAIGRVYYGLHHEACRRYFRQEPAAPSLERGRRHNLLIERFHDPTDATVNDISNLLRQLSRMRNIADYELRNTVLLSRRSLDSNQLMTFALLVADELLQALETYSPGEASEDSECRVSNR